MSALKIKSVEPLPLRLPLKKPVIMASERLEHAETMLVRIEAVNGLVGWGEASSAPTMTGETLDSMTSMVRNVLGPLLDGADALERGRLATRLDAAVHANHAAKAAVEMALNDLAGRHLGVSVTEFFGGAARPNVAPMYLIGTPTVDGDAEDAVASVTRGFQFLKLKCGSRPVEVDIAAARAVRAAVGPKVRLCADANMGMSFRDAVAYAEAIAELEFDFFEQPFGAGDIRSMARLARVSAVPLAGDESIGTLNDIFAFQSADAIAGVNLKTIKCGGLAATHRAATVCNALGLKIKLACKVAETSIGAAALTHLAYSIDNVDWGISLSNVYLANDVVAKPLLPQSGTVSRPAGPGLGVTVDEAAVRTFRMD